MFKFILLLAALCIFARFALGKWPWDYARGPSAAQRDRANAIAHARHLLGVGAQAPRDEIMAAHKALIARVHPDKGGSNAKVHQADQARDILLKHCS